MADVTPWQEFSKGVVRDNPLLVLALGLCPALAVTTTTLNGLGMGLAATFVLVCSNIVVSLLRNFIPKGVRIPAFIVVIASFVTIVDMTMEAYLFSLHQSLGLFIPLIVVNCMILGRAEAFAYRQGLFRSVLDGLGMGLGFLVALTLMGVIRELLGNGTLMTGSSLEIVPFGSGFQGNPMLVMILPPGAFLTLGLLLVGVNKLTRRA